MALYIKRLIGNRLNVEYANVYRYMLERSTIIGNTMFDFVQNQYSQMESGTRGVLTCEVDPERIKGEAFWHDSFDDVLVGVEQYIGMINRIKNGQVSWNVIHDDFLSCGQNVLDNLADWFAKEVVFYRMVTERSQRARDVFEIEDWPWPIRVPVKIIKFPFDWLEDVIDKNSPSESYPGGHITVKEHWKQINERNNRRAKQVIKDHPELF